MIRRSSSAATSATSTAIAAARSLRLRRDATGAGSDIAGDRTLGTMRIRLAAAGSILLVAACGEDSHDTAQTPPAPAPASAPAHEVPAAPAPTASTAAQPAPTRESTPAAPAK